MGRPGGSPEGPHAVPLHGSTSHALPLAQVAIVGAGNMGGAMVARLGSLGWSVVVCDIDPLRQQQASAAGARLSETPLGAAQASVSVAVYLSSTVASPGLLLPAQSAGAAPRHHSPDWLRSVRSAVAGAKHRLAGPGRTTVPAAPFARPDPMRARRPRRASFAKAKVRPPPEGPSARAGPKSGSSPCPRGRLTSDPPTGPRQGRVPVQKPPERPWPQR